MTGVPPLERARRLRTAAAAYPADVEPAEVVGLLRHPGRAVQREAAAALLALVTESPAAGRTAVGRCGRLLTTLSVDDADASDPAVAFGRDLLLSLARIATDHPEAVVGVEEQVRAQVQTPDGPLAGPASVCLVQLAAAEPGRFVGRVELFARLARDGSTAAGRNGAHALLVVADAHPGAVAPAVDDLARAVGSDDDETAKKAATALGRVARARPEAVEPQLEAVLARFGHEAPAVRANVAGVVADVAAERPEAVAGHLGPVTAALDDEVAPVRRNAVTALARVVAGGAYRESGEGTDAAVPVGGGLIELVDDPDPRVRAIACRALGHLRAPAPAELLRETADSDPEPTVREAAEWAVARIAG